MPVTLLRPYCTLGAVQSLTGDSDPDSVDQLHTAINAASRMIEEHCGRDFWFHDHSATAYRVERKAVVGNLAFLPFEVITLTGVTLDDVELTLDDVYYVAGSRTLSYLSNWGGTPFLGKLDIKGTFGYALDIGGAELPPPLVPSAIARSCTLIAAALSGLWRKERVGLDGGRESILETRIPAEATGLLKRWTIRGKLAQF